MLGAVMFGHDSNQIVIDAIIELAEACAKEPRAIHQSTRSTTSKRQLHEAIRRSQEVDSSWQSSSSRACHDSKEKGLALLEAEMSANVASDVLKAMEADIVRGSIWHRQTDWWSRYENCSAYRIRSWLLPRAHGSALFTRGETQALVVTTLERGKTKLLTRWRETVKILCSTITSHLTLLEKLAAWGAGRREIGHGKLPESNKALLPSKDDFPYYPRGFGDNRIQWIVVNGNSMWNLNVYDGSGFR